MPDIPEIRNTSGMYTESALKKDERQYPGKRLRDGRLLSFARYARDCAKDDGGINHLIITDYDER